MLCCELDIQINGRQDDAADMTEMTTIWSTVCFALQMQTSVYKWLRLRHQRRTLTVESAAQPFHPLRNHAAHTAARDLIAEYASVTEGSLGVHHTMMGRYHVYGAHACSSPQARNRSVPHTAAAQLLGTFVGTGGRLDAGLQRPCSCPVPSPWPDRLTASHSELHCPENAGGRMRQLGVLDDLQKCSVTQSDHTKGAQTMQQNSGLL